MFVLHVITRKVANGCCDHFPVDNSESASTFSFDEAQYAMFY